MPADDQILLLRPDAFGPGAVAEVVFNRPDQRNAISYDMWRRLAGIMSELADDSAVRCIVFRGAGGRAFSAGADIKDFDEHRYDSASAARYADAFDGALDRIEHCPIPTLAAIDGYCVGGGMELAAATDIRIASANSRFGIPVSRLGLTAGWDELRRLINVVGIATVKHLLLTGHIVDAEHALRAGFISQIVATDGGSGPISSHDIVSSLIADIASGAPLAARDHKLMIQRLSRNPDTATLTDDERALMFRVFDSEDFAEGVAAFKAKRKPRFRGR